MDKTCQDEVSTGGAAMGNETSRDFKHDLGTTGKPGQFHRVLAEPDYSAIDTPILTKLNISGDLRALPEQPTTSTSDTGQNGLDPGVIKLEHISDTSTDKNDQADIEEKRIQAAARELVEQVVNDALAKVNGEKVTIDSAALNGDIKIGSDSALPTESKPTASVIEVSVNGETGIELVRETDANTIERGILNGDIEPNIITSHNTEDDQSQTNIKDSVGDESPLAVEKGKTQEKKKNKVKKSKSKKSDKSEKYLRERELIDSVKEDIKKAAADEKKAEKGRGFMKMFKFSKRKPNVDAEVLPNASGEVGSQETNMTVDVNIDGKDTPNLNHVDELNKSDSINLDDKVTDSKVEIDVFNINGDAVHADNLKDTKSIDSGVVIDKVNDIKVNGDAVLDKAGSLEEISVGVVDLNSTDNNAVVVEELDTINDITKGVADLTSDGADKANDVGGIATDIAIEKAVDIQTHAAIQETNNKADTTDNDVKDIKDTLEQQKGDTDVAIDGPLSETQTVTAINVEKTADSVNEQTHDVDISDKLELTSRSAVALNADIKLEAKQPECSKDESPDTEQTATEADPVNVQTNDADSSDKISLPSSSSTCITLNTDMNVEAKLPEFSKENPSDKTTTKADSASAVAVDTDMTVETKLPECSKDESTDSGKTTAEVDSASAFTLDTNINVETKQLPEISKDELTEIGKNITEEVKQFSERGVDVDGLQAAAEQTVNGTELDIELPQSLPTVAEGSELVADPATVTSANTAETATDDGVKDKYSKPGKTKRRSWSFQIGGNKKKSEGADNETDEAKDKSSEVKKPRWKLGKLSFRKSSSEVSASTPNLNEAGIPEEGHSDAKRAPKEGKRKSLLKQIKAKKEKKKESQKKEAEGFERRSNSLMDIVIGDNKPGSRRSIVEDDVPYTQTDAFDGVDLSDLSADEDATVSKNPSGSDKKPESKGNGIAARAKGLFKLDKKKTPTVSPVTDEKPPTAPVVVDVNTPVAPVISDDVKALAVPAVADNKTVLNGIKFVEDGEYAQIRHVDVKDDVGLNKDDVDAGVNVNVEKPEVPEPKLSHGDETPVCNTDLVATVKENVNDVYAQIVKRDSETGIKVEGNKDIGNDIADTIAVEQNVMDKEELAIRTSIPDVQAIAPQIAPKAEASVSVAHVDISHDSGHSNPTYEISGSPILTPHVGELKPEIRDTDSDAYVQLEQLVGEMKPETVSPKLSVPTPNIDTTLVTDNDKDIAGDGTSVDPVKVADKLLNDVSEIIKPSNVQVTCTEPTAEVKVKPRVIIMKEVGVQAPDIHMPLDIEKDFGFYSENVPKVSVGIQVCDDAMDMNKGQESQEPSKSPTTASSAYF